MNEIIAQYRAHLEKLATQELSLRPKPWQMGIYAGHKGDKTHRGPAYASGVGTAAVAGAGLSALPGAVAGGPPVARALTSKGRRKMLTEGIHDVSHGSAGAERVGRAFAAGAGRSLASNAPDDVKAAVKSTATTAKAVGSGVSDVTGTSDTAEMRRRASRAKADVGDKAGKAGEDIKDVGSRAGKAVKDTAGKAKKSITDAYQAGGLKGVKDHIINGATSAETQKLIDRFQSSSGKAREEALTEGVRDAADAFKKTRLPEILKRRAKGTGKAMLVGAGVVAGGKALTNAARYESGRTLATEKKKKGRGMKKSASANLALGFAQAAEASIVRAGFNEHLVKIACAEELEKIAVVGLATRATARTLGWVGRGAQRVGLKGLGSSAQRKAGKMLGSEARRYAARGAAAAAQDGGSAAARVFRGRSAEFGQEAVKQQRGAMRSANEGLQHHLAGGINPSYSARRATKLSKQLDEAKGGLKAARKDVKETRRTLNKPKKSPTAPATAPTPTTTAAPTAAAPTAPAGAPAAPTAPVAGAAPAAPTATAPAGEAGTVGAWAQKHMGWTQPAAAGTPAAAVPLGQRAANWFQGLNNSQLRNNLLLGVGGVGAAGMAAGGVGHAVLGGDKTTVVYR